MDSWKIVIHRGPHLADFVALVILMFFGKKAYPGIDRAEIVFYDPEIHGNGAFSTGEEKEWLEKKVIFIGLRQGMFDHHPHSESRKCCEATLVLEHLLDLSCIEDEKAWELVEKWTTKADTGLVDNPMHPANLMKSEFYRDGDDFDIAYWLEFTNRHLVRNLLYDQRDFLEALPWARNLSHEDVVNQNNGKTYRLVWYKQSEGQRWPGLIKAARHSDGGNGDIVLVEGANGGFYISAQQNRYDPRLKRKVLRIPNVSKLAFLLRKEVLRLPAYRQDDVPDKHLSADGELLNIFHFLHGGQIFAGPSLRFPQQKVSGITFNRTKACCKQALETFTPPGFKSKDDEASKKRTLPKSEEVTSTIVQKALQIENASKPETEKESPKNKKPWWHNLLGK